MDNRKTFYYPLSMHWNISTLMTKQQREKRLEVSRYFGRTIRPSSGDLKKKALKKDGLSVQNIGKPQVAFVFAVFLLMSIFLSWIEQEDLALVILYIEDITRWREDMNFIFSWQKQYFTHSLRSFVKYCFATRK